MLWMKQFQPKATVSWWLELIWLIILIFIFIMPKQIFSCLAETFLMTKRLHYNYTYACLLLVFSQPFGDTFSNESVSATLAVPHGYLLHLCSRLRYRGVSHWNIELVTLIRNIQVCFMNIQELFHEYSDLVTECSGIVSWMFRNCIMNIQVCIMNIQVMHYVPELYHEYSGDALCSGIVSWIFRQCIMNI